MSVRNLMNIQKVPEREKNGKKLYLSWAFVGIAFFSCLPPVIANRAEANFSLSGPVTLAKPFSPYSLAIMNFFFCDTGEGFVAPGTVTKPSVIVGGFAFRVCPRKPFLSTVTTENY